MNVSTKSILTITPYVIISLITLGLVVIILYNCGWLYEDIGPIINNTAIGKYMPLSDHIMPWEGRIGPLSGYDYNILLLLGYSQSPIGYFLLLALYFVVLVYLLVKLISDALIKIEKSVYNGWIVLFLTLYIIQRFFDPLYLQLQYAERLVLPLLLLFVYCYIKFKESNKNIFAIIAFLSAFFITYCKEVNSGILLVFSLTNLLFDKDLGLKLKKFNVLVVANSIVFYLIYVIFIVPETETTYYSGTGLSSFELIVYILRNQKLIIIGLLLGIIRAYYLIVKKDRNNVVFDSMLYAGISLFVVSIILRLEYYYYYSPTLILIAPAIVYYSIKLLGHKFTLIVVLIFFGLYFYKIIPSIINIQERRQTEYIKVKEIVNLVNQGYNIFWYEVESNDIKNQNMVYRNWSRDLVKDHIRFNLRNNSYDIKTIKHIENKQKTIYLVSTLNEKLANDKYLMQVEIFPNKKKYSLQDIDVYILE